MDEPGLLQAAKPAFEKYNEEQLTVVDLPGSGKKVCIFILEDDQIKRKMD